MLLSTAVQLRIGPIGAGELAGVCAALLCLAMSAGARAPSVLFLKYASLVCGAVFFGGVTSLFLRGQEFAWLEFVGMTYAFVLAATVMLASEKSILPMPNFFRYLLLIPVVQVLLFVSDFFIGLGLSIWFSEDGPTSSGLPLINRFVGWATFPNQLGIAISGMPFVILWLRQQRWGSSLFLSLAFVCTIVCGLLILSNTVFVAWILGMVSVVLSRSAFSIRLSFNRGQDVFTTLALLSLVTVLGTLTVFLLVPQFFEFLFVKGDDADLNGRLPLWTASIEAWSVSPLVGLGPGAHARVAGQGVAAESHLLFLDVLTQGGVIALVGLLGIFLWSCGCAVKSRNGLLIGLVVAVTVEALAHNTQRHPVFWLYLVLPAVILHSRKWSVTGDNVDQR
jgi:O-antigen ligase